jgi:hypothetical protein
MNPILIICLGMVVIWQQGARPGFREIVSANFPRWDGNQDGKLSTEELNALIEDPRVKGAEAAAVVEIRNAFSKHKFPDKSLKFSRDQLFALGNDASVRDNFDWDMDALRSCTHELFLPGDPKFSTVQQGRTGDCYLLAVIGASVNSDPEKIRKMIKPLPQDCFEVDFPDGTKTVVRNVTDAELLEGAKVSGEHGVWLDVLEKAFAQLKKGSKTTQNEDGSESLVGGVPRDILAGGKTPPTIQRFSGHKVINQWLTTPAKKGSTLTVQQIDELLAHLTEQHRLVTAGKLKRGLKLPPQIIYGHCWAIVGYDSKSRTVRIFNPWGNEFTPVGPPGLVNGRAVHHGVFEMPLPEFLQVFQKINYETDEPLNG